jgi:hypothetical protein
MSTPDKHFYICILVTPFILSGCLSSPLIDEVETRNSSESSLLCINQNQEDTLAAILTNIQICYPPSKMSSIGSQDLYHFYNDFKTRINGENDFTIIWTSFYVNKLKHQDPLDRYIDIKPGLSGCQTQVLLTMHHFTSDPLRALITQWTEDLPYQCPPF